MKSFHKHYSKQIKVNHSTINRNKHLPPYSNYETEVVYLPQYKHIPQSVFISQMENILYLRWKIYKIFPDFIASKMHVYTV